jgi:microcystin-dependent protein
VVGASAVDRGDAAIAVGGTDHDVIGTTYGGDGQNSFAVPDLRSRVPICEGQGRGLSNYLIDTTVGVENVKLTTNQLPAHTHPVSAVDQPGNTNVPASNALLAQLGGQAASGEYQLSAYAPPGQQTALNPASVGRTGHDRPHPNVQPFQAISYCIALTGPLPVSR